MNDDEVLDRARANGFELIELVSAGQWATAPTTASVFETHGSSGRKAAQD